MDPKVKFLDDVRPMNITELFRVRSIEGVDWAVPLFKGNIRANVQDGNFQLANMIGIDTATFIGRPPIMLEGTLEGLRNTDGVIVSREAAENQFAIEIPGTKEKRPMRVGDTLELNDKRAVVMGICEISRTFQTRPIIYTTYRRALRYTPFERKNLSFVLVHSAPGITPKELCRRIERITGLSAYTNREFAILTVNYFLTRTGIPINFGFAIFLGFVIGIAIAGQTFYNFTLDNLRYFGTLKAMGADNDLLTRMVVVQSVVVATIGWGMGIGAAAIFGIFSKGTQLSFRLPWQLFIGSFLAILLLCFLSAIFSIRRVRKLEPAIVFKT